MILSLWVLLTLTAPRDAQPGEVSRNPHVVHTVERFDGGVVRVTYRFKTHEGELVTFVADYSEPAMRRGAAQLGVPAWVHEPHDARLRPLVDQAIAEGLMRRAGRGLHADPRLVVRYYDDLTRPIALWLRDWLAARNRDTRAQRIALAMAFVQDIPYAIPKDHSTWSTTGVVAPPQLLLEGWGDCDSKAYFFMGLLRALIDPRDVLVVRGEDHLLTAIAGVPGRGDQFFTKDGRTYLVAETAGPSRPALGRRSALTGAWQLEPLQE